MRLHFLASTLVRGGAETMAVALSRRLAERGHEVLWSLLRDAGDLGASLTGALRPRTGLAPGRFPWSGLPRLRTRLRGSDALYVLDHRNAVVLGAVAGGVVPRRVVAVHTTGLWGGRPSLDRVFRAALRGYDAVLALSATHAAYLREREGVREDRIRVVPNGIDLGRFEALPTRALARASLGIDAESPVLGAVAMLRPEKNLALLLRAAASLRAEFPALRLALVGDGPERPALESLARDLAILDRVLFAGRREDVPSLLPAFDIVVLPSFPQVETQPVAVLEAMAAGVPVVATRVGDLESMLEGGEAGLLVPSDDAEALAGTLGQLLGDPARRSRLAERALVRVRDYGLDAATDALELAWSPAA